MLISYIHEVAKLDQAIVVALRNKPSIKPIGKALPLKCLFALSDKHLFSIVALEHVLDIVNRCKSNDDASKKIFNDMILWYDTHMAYLLLYVDDIVLTGSSTQLLTHIISLLSTEFSMSDLGDLHYFLGVLANRSVDGLFLSQQKYAAEILDRAFMKNCKPTSSPTDLSVKFDGTGPPVDDPTLYRSLAGTLQYLMLTRLDITYVVQQICLYIHDLREPHFTTLKHILCYIRDTTSYGLQLYTPSRTLTAYSDADWDGCPVTQRSTSSYCVFLGNNLLSWSSKLQNTISRSSAKAEYRGVANALAETCWIRNLLFELYYIPAKETLVYCDNVSVVYMSSNPVHHKRTEGKIIDDYSFVLCMDTLIFVHIL
ncbi:uncharacterized mitochondrial protein AtMg00810-like [Lactuca sativa]|uniref:uncharacterized mitochondrial protein AtMg00810-like n=1 Tax=Lactuca sativa TaxID=4236 RepID=UPI000CD83E0A|nr:uncharacterized mitochondrial protein AtMg00810-like [Lactuca sativa]